jgi:hypothetical protein
MLEKAFIIGFMVFAIHYTMLPGEIFSKISDWLFNHIPERLRQPLFACPICMVPWYGSVIYWLLWGTSLTEWIVVMITAVGINFRLNLLYGKGE